MSSLLSLSIGKCIPRRKKYSEQTKTVDQSKAKKLLIKTTDKTAGQPVVTVPNKKKLKRKTKPLEKGNSLIFISLHIFFFIPKNNKSLKDIF